MGLIDAFSKEDRVPVTFSDFYCLMKEAAKTELLMNAVNCNVPHRYIRETMTGKAEKYPLRRKQRLRTNDEQSNDLH